MACKYGKIYGFGWPPIGSYCFHIRCLINLINRYENNMKSIWFGSGSGFLAPTRRKHIFSHIYFILFSYFFVFIPYLFHICFVAVSSQGTPAPRPPPAPVPGPDPGPLSLPSPPRQETMVFSIFKCESTSKLYFQPYFILFIFFP